MSKCCVAIYSNRVTLTKIIHTAVGVTDYKEIDAKYKLAYQMSTFAYHNASHAVDGNTAMDMPTCTHTESEVNPWWYVDLGDYYDLLEIIIYNRIEHGDRLRDVSVLTGSSLAEMNECGQFKGPAGDGQVSCTCGTNKIFKRRIPLNTFIIICLIYFC